MLRVAFGPTPLPRESPLREAPVACRRDFGPRRAAADCCPSRAWRTASCDRRPQRALRPKRLAHGFVRLDVGPADQVDAVGHGRKYAVERFLDRLRLARQ